MRSTGNIQRLDRILRAEGDDPNRYKMAKQADTVMLFLLFSGDELRAMLRAARLHLRLGHGRQEHRLLRPADFAWLDTEPHLPRRRTGSDPSRELMAAAPRGPGE